MNIKKDAYIDHGGRGEPIVLLHGFLSSSQYWTKLQPLLSHAGYRVITIDLLGFGNAPKPAIAHYDYTDHVRHINAVLDKIRLDEPFVLIGHSMGALIAARYSILFPANIRSLALLHPPLYSSPHEAHQTLRDTGRAYRFLLDSPYRQLIWIVIRGLCFSFIGNHRRISRESSLRNIIETAEIFNDLEIINSKTLLFVGTRDRKEYRHNVSMFKLSHSVSVLIGEVDHHSPRKHPLIIRDILLDFLT